ncbi:hypothetical protein [Flavobacterium sp.]|uniref:hypothetical protein n=1 Tax=Flavobacterium sp. TaxID=239 RepID=UPI002FD9DDB1
MKYRDLLIGLFIGMLTSALGVFVFLKLFTPYNPLTDLPYLKEQGLMGKIVTLGTVLNILLFFVLLKFKKDLMAKGVIAAIAVLTIFTLFL